jgi:ferrous iron transport protein B
MNTLPSVRIALAGNPNCGKTTLFNTITGSHQKVGNYAGVTVEKKEGVVIHKGIECILYDLPGIYSLTAYSIDEMVSRDFIINEKPDVIIDVLDSTNIERNLYLCLQFQELGIPVVGALNIIDQAESRGIRIDEGALGRILGIPLVKTIGSKDVGIETLLDAAIAVASKTALSQRSISYGMEVEREIGLLSAALEKDPAFTAAFKSRWVAIKLLEKDAEAHKKLQIHEKKVLIEHLVDESIRRIEAHFGRDSEIIVSEQRYGYVHGAVAESVKRVALNHAPMTEAVDRILLNRVLGFPIFLFILWAIFQITFVAGDVPMHWLESFFGWFSIVVKNGIGPGILQSLLVDGVIGGVGGVLSFVPLIIILFVCISFLEDTGYMSRAAFIMDKFLHIFGLHGQSFLPMMIGFGCSVPAVMAARTLKNPRDRIVTILVTPFMSCGAKLPVHVLLAAAFFPKNSGNMVMFIYVIGVALALTSSLVFRHTILKGDATPFVMELPPYRMPTVGGLLWHVWDKTAQYLKKAGTVLLAASILIWVLVSFPHHSPDVSKIKTAELSYRAEHETLWKSQGVTSEVIERNLGNYMKVVQRQDALYNSFAGRIGRVIEPVIKPLGFDWKIGISIITGFAAKEVVVSTLGILYKAGEDTDRENDTLRTALQQDPAFNPLVAFVLMLFTLILAPCLAAQAAIRAEIGWKWLGFFDLYSIVASWAICFTVYQAGKILGIGV